MDECVLFSRLLLQSDDQIWHSIVMVVSDLACSAYCNQGSNSSIGLALSAGSESASNIALKVVGGYCIIVNLNEERNCSALLCDGASKVAF